MPSTDLALVLAALVLVYAITAWAIVRWRESGNERLKISFEMKRLRFAQQQHGDLLTAAQTRHLGGNYPPRTRGPNRDGDN